MTEDASWAFNKLVACYLYLVLLVERCWPPAVHNWSQTLTQISGRKVIDRLHNLAERSIYSEIATYTVTSTPTCSKAFLNLVKKYRLRTCGTKCTDNPFQDTLSLYLWRPFPHWFVAPACVRTSSKSVFFYFGWLSSRTCYRQNSKTSI